MKIYCVNWQAADDAELERQHYPEIELILARSTNDTAATLDAVTAKTVDAVINYSPAHNVPLPPTAFPNAKIAVRSGVGYDNIDTVGWGARNIPACNVPDYGTTEVADHAIALMLSLTRGTFSYPNELVAGGAANWHFNKAPLIRRHKNATFGIAVSKQHDKVLGAKLSRTDWAFRFCFVRFIFVVRITHIYLPVADWSIGQYGQKINHSLLARR